MADFSDFIVFVDESGDHGLASIDPQFPVFALAFCVIAKEDYAVRVVPAFQRFKFEFWGHDGVVLHEHELRKQEGPFAFLRTDAALRARFFEQLNDIVVAAPFRVIASVIDKRALLARYNRPFNPYEIALRFCLERLLAMMIADGQRDRLVHVVFESRGTREDRELELEFRRICANGGNWGYRRADFSRVSFQPRFLPKAALSTGLQMADLVARPIALRTIRPDQPNRAFDMLQSKLADRKVFP